jgi:signal transduction histidine kinase/CheY-like chemotaxis protein
MLTEIKILTLFLFFCFSAFSQEIDKEKDSLTNILESGIPDTSEVIILNRLSAIEKDNILSLNYAYKAMTTAERLNFEKGLLDAYQNLAYAFYASSDFEKSIDYFDKAYQLIKDSEQKQECAKLLNNIGLISSKLGDYKKAIEYSLLSLEIKEVLKDEKGIATTLTNLAIYYRQLEFLEESEKQLEKAYKIYSSLKDSIGISIIYNEMGILYKARAVENSEEILLDSAKYFFISSLEIKRNLQTHPLNIANTINNLGLFEFERGNYGEALEYHFEALNLRKEFSDIPGMVSSYINIGDCYLKQNVDVKALEYYNMAEEMLEVTQLLLSKKRLFKSLYDYYKPKNEYQRALFYFEKLSLVKDSLLNIEKTKAITSLQKDFELNQQLLQNEKLRAENDKHVLELKQKESSKLIIILVVIILLLTSVFIIWFKFRRIKFEHAETLQELNKQLEKKVEERTEKLNLEIEERKTIEENLEIAKERAEKATKSKSLFLANMSHEIRTPMNSIVNMAELLKETELNDKQNEMLGIIEYCGDNLVNIVNDILDLSKIEASQVKLEKMDFNPAEIIESIQKVFDFRVKQKNLELITNIDKKLPQRLTGDAYRLKQVLTNLVSNAVKYTKEGSITLTAKLKNKIENKATIYFEVADTGFGMKEESLQKIFDAFSRLDQPEAIEGTGLGLAITKNIINMMGGKIGVESEYKKGSKFWVTIDFEIKEIKVEEEKQVKKVLNIKPENLNVLIAEDDVINQRLITLILNKNNFKFKIAENGQKAVDFFKEEDFHVILMDIDMPVLDGIEATREIRKYEKENKLPGAKIIAVTAKVTTSDKKECLAAGMNAFISKPFKTEELLGELTTV